MKNKFLASVMCAALIVSLSTGNFKVSYAEKPDSSITSEQVTKENFLGLPSEKLVEDFEYYWKTMKENSPLFNATKKHIPDLEEQFETYKKRILESKSNYEQLALIDEFSCKFLGHNGIIWDRCSYFIKAYGAYPERQTWSKILAVDPLTERNTDMYNYFRHQEESKLTKSTIQVEPRENVTTKIIEPGKIAYIKVASFCAEHVGPHDEKIIGDFFEKTKNYDNLIIDITGNGGGHDAYLSYFAPILKNSFTVTDYYLFKVGDDSAKYIDEVYPENVQTIDKCPEFPCLNPEDKKELTHFIECIDVLHPLPNPFKGKVWLLVDNKVFSASERFASLCKLSKEVTLVGKNTNGDGIGIDPIFIVLPNSKVALRYSLEYGLNIDGSSNAELGTKPDIVSPGGENPLTTCLRAIRGTSENKEINRT